MNTDRTTLAKMTILLCVGVAALAVGSAADGKAASPGGKGIVFKLKEKHDSGVSGTARLIPAGSNVRVVLTLSKPSQDGLPAHIHTGPCRREPTFANPRIRNSLTSVVNGKSATTVTGTSLKTLRRGSFSINVHSPGYSVIACGDIPGA
ncbi:MAG: CHRD domain-containing protein [Gaiellaceae bacterium]